LGINYVNNNSNTAVFNLAKNLGETMKTEQFKERETLLDKLMPLMKKLVELEQQDKDLWERSMYTMEKYDYESYLETEYLMIEIHQQKVELHILKAAIVEQFLKDKHQIKEH
jgi:hypothetical protein